MTTWRHKIGKLMEENGEAWLDVIHVAICEGGLDVEFDDGHGNAQGPAFTLWTRERVYFPVEYDGLDLVNSILRNPCDERHNHGTDYVEVSK